MNTPVMEDVLILAKTYPSPSTQYRETTCVAGVNSRGELRRLFPVPFRLLGGESQFKKWEWIRARLSIPNGDRRPESRRIDTDSIIRTGEVIQIKGGDWSERLQWIEPHVVKSFSALEERRKQSGETLGFIRPSRLLKLEITSSKEKDWTEQDKIKLSQDGLFDSLEVKKRPVLRKLPYDFHYIYSIDTPAGTQEHRHKLTDWEAGALYWNCVESYGPQWETKFRQRYETEFCQKDLLFLMGTIHRFPDQWLIVGVVYPPKPPQTRELQLDLGLGQ
jgi:hypothetical protein